MGRRRYVGPAMRVWKASGALLGLVVRQAGTAAALQQEDS